MRGPGEFLRFRPPALRASGQNNRVKVSHGLVEVHRIWQERKVAVEVAASDDAVPEFRSAEKLFSLSGFLPKQFSGSGIEVGQDAVTIYE